MPVLLVAILCTLQLGCSVDGSDLRVIGVSPQDGQRDVVTNTFIEIAFSAQMDRASVERNIETFPDIRFNQPYVWIDNRILRLMPVNPLGTRVQYTVVLHKGARDINGRVFEQDQRWSFITIDPPYVVSSTPDKFAQDVTPGSPIQLVFNRPMNSESVLSASNFVNQGLVPEWQANNRILILRPRNDTPQIKHPYDLTISEDAKDSMGNPMVGRYELAFTTGTEQLAVTKPETTTTPTPVVTPPSQPAGVQPVAAIAGTYNLGMAGSNGVNPENIAYNPKTQRIYVVNSLSRNVTVIDATSLHPLATIEVGDHPSGIAIDTERNLIYVANYNSNTISVISGTTDSLILSFSPNRKPDKLALLTVPGEGGNPAQTYLYVTHPDEGQVSIINLSNYTVEQVISGLGQMPRDLAVDEKALRVYVANGASNLVYIINARTNKREDLPLQTRAWAESVAVDPGLGRVYVANLDGTLDIFDQAGGKPLVSGIFIGRNPRDVAVDAEHHLVYIVGDDQRLLVLDGTTGDLRSAYKLEGGTAQSIAIAPAINRLYLAHPTTNSVSVLDLVSNNRIEVIPLSTTLADGAINSNSNTLYILDSENNQIYKIADGGIIRQKAPSANNTVMTQIVADEESGRVYISGGNQEAMLDGQTLAPLGTPLTLSDTVRSMTIAGPYLYLSLTGRNELVRVDKLRNQILNIWPVPEQPGVIAIDGKNNRIYIAHGTTGMVSVLDATTGQLVRGPVKIGETLRGITLADDKLYVTSFNENVVYVLSPELSVIKRIPVGLGPSGIAFLPANHLLFVACTQFNQISLIDTQTDTSLPSLALPSGSQPNVVVPDPRGNRVYIINSRSSTVSIIQASAPRTTTPQPTPNPVPPLPIQTPTPHH